MKTLLINDINKDQDVDLIILLLVFKATIRSKKLTIKLFEYEYHNIKLPLSNAPKEIIDYLFTDSKDKSSVSVPIDKFQKFAEFGWTDV